MQNNFMLIFLLNLLKGLEKSLNIIQLACMNSVLMCLVSSALRPEI